jgi:RNA polymerase sigma-70 factor, ECF subfamily
MSAQGDLYRKAAREHGAALERLTRAYEAGPEERRDPLQEIHFALWRSFENFDHRCSLRTWVYRVAHNAATSHVLRSRRTGRNALISLEGLGDSRELASNSTERSLESGQILAQLYAFIQGLNPIDRQVILLYLEGLDAASISEIAGISASYTATKIHRIKRILANRFRSRVSHDAR